MNKYLILLFLLILPIYGQVRSSAEKVIAFHLSQVRRSNSNSHRNQYEILNEITSELFERGFLCPKRTMVSTDCFREDFLRSMRKARRKKMIDKVTFLSLKQLVLRATFEGILVIPEISRVNALQDTLGPLSTYLKNKNEFDSKKIDAQKHEEILKRLNKLYKRKKALLGKLSVREYILLSFNRAQMSELFSIVNKAINGYQIGLSNACTFFTQDFDRKALNLKLKEKEKLLDIKLNLFELDPALREKLKEEIYQLRDEIKAIREDIQNSDLIGQLESLKAEKMKLKFDYIETRLPKYQKEIELLSLEQKVLEERIESETYSFEMDPVSCYRLIVNKLEQDLSLLPVNKPETFFNKQVSLGDAVLAFYLYGSIDPEGIEGIINLEEFQENHQGFLKNAQGIVLSLSRIFLVSNPATSPYAILGFILYDSLKQKRRYENEESRRSHLVH